MKGLPVAAFLMADLRTKLAASLAAARRPAFARPVAAKPGAAADSPAVILAALQPLLPFLRQQLDFAASAIRLAATEGTGFNPPRDPFSFLFYLLY